MVLSENHKYQIALGSCHIQDKKIHSKQNIRIGTQDLRVILTNKTDDLK